MARTLAALLVHRLSSVGDAKARVKLLLSELPGFHPEELAEARAELVLRAGRRDTAAQVTLLALAEAEIAALPPAELSTESATQHDWGTGRPLTLGERKSLARRPQRAMLDRALRDPHPDVIRELLQNPRLTEDDVVRLCASRHATAAALVRVFLAPRWASHERVRFAMASNRRCPLYLAEALLPLLGQQSLRELAQDPSLEAGLRRLAEQLVHGAASPPEEADEVL